MDDWLVEGEPMDGCPAADWPASGCSPIVD